MTRQQFIDFLARAVVAEWMTEPEAVERLKAFDRGEIPEDQLPLPLEEAIRGVPRA